MQTVVSTGGGVMTMRDNLPLLHTGLILWLDLTVSRHTPSAKRIVLAPPHKKSHGSSRPAHDLSFQGAKLMIGWVCLCGGLWQPEAIIERMQESGEIDKRPLLKQVRASSASRSSAGS